MADGFVNNLANDFFTEALASRDPAVFASITDEMTRQRDEIELIASENIVSRAVMEAQGSVMTNKYAEGYPDRRYYGGCQYVDVAESLAIERACKLFGCDFANVQPHSGAQANQAVFQACIKPGDTFLGMDLASGGHLTHGAAPNQSGKWFNAIQYGVTKDTNLIDYDQVAALAKEHQPKLIVAGGSAVPRQIDFKRFREIADSVGALLMFDAAHVAGLIAGGVYPNPMEVSDIVTFTTHKTLRGPRGGCILSTSAHAKAMSERVGPLIDRYRRPGVLMDATEPLTIRDRLTFVPISTNSIESGAPSSSSTSSDSQPRADSAAETVPAGPASALL